MRFLRENLALKVVSLALAISVWLYVRGEEKPVQILSVPLELQNLPPDLAIAGDVIESVSVRVRAPSIVLESITPERFLARVDLSALSAGDQMVRVRSEQMRIPPGVEVVKISPEFVPLRLERKVAREVPVKARIAGEPAAGYVIDETRIDPPHVEVEGPEEAVKLAHEVLTDTVRVDGRSAPFDAQVGLTPDHFGLRLVGESQALLHLNIHERWITKVITGVKVETVGTSIPVKVSPDTLSVTLEGPPGALTDLGPAALTAIVDLAAVAPKAGEYRVKPQVRFKDDVVGARMMVRQVSAAEIIVWVPQRRGR